MKISDKTNYVSIKVIPDKKFKTTCICLMLRRPLRRGEATLNALLASVLSCGSAKYPNLYEINKYMEELFGAVFSGQIIKKGEFQIIRFYIEIVSSADSSLVGKAVDFLHEILCNPLIENGSFSDEIVENEKAMLKDAIEDRINDKNEYARLKCVEKMCAEEPFGIYADGYAEDIDNLNAKTLCCHYRNILRSTPLEFIVTGNVDEQVISEAINSKFINSDFRPSLLKVEEILYNPSEAKSFEELQNINQGKICIGLRANADYRGDSFYTLLVLNEVLGGSGNSRLFINLREKDSLCYNIFSFVYRVKAILMIQCGVDIGNMDTATQKINEQIDAMKLEVSEDEVNMAKKSLLSHFMAIRDYQGQILDFYYTQYILDDTEDIEGVIKGIENVQPADISALAKSLYTDTIFMLGGDKNGQTA